MHLITVLVCLLVGFVLTSADAQQPRAARTSRLFSYICLASQDRLCLGISTPTEPRYRPNNLLHLQVKMREKIENKGTDYLQTRWSVYAEDGHIQLANFTSLCLARESSQFKVPGEVVLRQCDTQGALENWALKGFLQNETENSMLSLEAFPDQCLTVMVCDRRVEEHCDPRVQKPHTKERMVHTRLTGAYVKLMPCSLNLPSQQFKQTIDCAPGCSPFMMEDPGNVCDPECANDQCNFDNGACVTPAPTPPTMSPTLSPSLKPSASPTVSPHTPRPSQSPQTSKPTKSPVTGPTTRAPGVVSPTVQPASVVPTTSESIAPTTSTSAPTGERGSLPPSPRGSSSGIAQPTENVGQTYWYVWLILVLLVLLLLCCVGGVCYRRRQQQPTPAGKTLEQEDKEEQANIPVEVPAAGPATAAPTTQAPTAGTSKSPAQTADSDMVDAYFDTAGDDLAIEDKAAPKQEVDIV